MMTNNWQALIQDHSYEEIEKFYESEIDAAPDVAENYHYLGLVYLLQAKEEEAQLTWFLGLENSLKSEDFNQELSKILRDEAVRQEESSKEYKQALLIRQYLREIAPKDFDNLVQIVYLSLQLEILNLEVLDELGLIELVQNVPNITSDNSLLQLIQNVMYSPMEFEESLNFSSYFLPYIQDKDTCIDMLLYMAGRTDFLKAVSLINLCLSLVPNCIRVLTYLVHILTKNGYYTKATEEAQRIVGLATNLYEQIATTHTLLGALMSSGGKWEETKLIFNDYQNLIRQVTFEEAKDLPEYVAAFLRLASFYTCYFNDDPSHERPLQNRIAQIFQINMQSINQERVISFGQQNYKTKPRSKKLKVGYLSTSLRQHSIGWLARSLIEFHDREKFEIYGYFPDSVLPQDILHQWYLGQFHKVVREGVECFGNPVLIADEINKDSIDILIDLESLTSSTCSKIIAQKPAPVQVTWLGWDASGLPAIDYYIADPYVLPENAQDYYSEKIWRLPNTYIAVNGFNHTVHTLCRHDLNISENAIVYFSAQNPRKRNPDIIHLQMQIIKQVPDSYFVIKGLGEEDAVQNFFLEIAEQEGVNRERLRFLGSTKSESEHRANLAIADVVLDTYPYNGATTTMEVLWMGIPLVTKVGTQFVSRNSYTMMMNVGISEGIAWTDAEYVEWGVRFGTEPDLRRDVAWKLRESRKTSPLWDGKQFAREMEKAYQQMWEIYING